MRIALGQEISRSCNFFYTFIYARRSKVPGTYAVTSTGVLGSLGAAAVLSPRRDVTSYALEASTRSWSTAPCRSSGGACASVMHGVCLRFCYFGP